MTTETAIEVQQSDREQEARRKLALLKAVGLDRAAPEQRELAVAIAKRYDLDLLLKHVVLVDGKPYLTRDALLWIAHRSGQFDGITVTRPALEGDYWYCEATVYRKDMTHPFTYGGRYPAKGGNVKFAPEMAVKVAESMALRRAFNVSAPTQDERWDVEVPTPAPAAPEPSLKERAAARAAAVPTPAQVEDGDWPNQQAGGDGPVAQEPEVAPPASGSAQTAEDAIEGEFTEAGLNAGELREWLDAHTTAVPYATDVAKRLFGPKTPDGKATDIYVITDQQRAQLRDELTK